MSASPRPTPTTGSNALPSSTDVLVVGYGPVGAAIACLLGRYGVDALVIDRETDILMMPRAVGMDNEGQRTLQIAGLKEDAFEKIAIPTVRLHCPAFGEFATFQTGGVIDGYPKLATFHQPDLERALRAEAENHASVNVVLGVELLGFTDSGDGVRARIDAGGGEPREIAARYLIGADGASSKVRHLIGQDFRGRSYPEDWLIIDARNVRHPIDHIDFHCKPGGAAPHLPAPGGRERWEFMLQPGETPEQMEQDSSIKKLLAPWGDPAEMEIERKAVYRFHARCVDSFRKGRVFLAGDAAHITPPFAGQGLMSGLRDAANLCWKLAWVLRGHASPAVLDSYDTERRPHARAMIDLARFLGQMVAPRSRFKAFLKHGLMRAIRLVPPVRSFLDELKMKPKHRYRKGLFFAGGERVTRGAWMPQGLVRGPDGDVCLSDDAFGDHLTLVGFGVDPREHLGAEDLEAWRAIGGNVVQIAMRGQRLQRSKDAWEDLTGALVPEAAPYGWAAVLRPDRLVLHDGPAADAARLLREARALLTRAAEGPQTAAKPRKAEAENLATAQPGR